MPDDVEQPGTERVSPTSKRQAVRAVNDRIAREAEAGPEADFVCECANERCFATVPMTVAERRAATVEVGYYAVRPGHVAEEEEVVIAATRYAIVRTAEPRGAGVDASASRPAL